MNEGHVYVYGRRYARRRIRKRTAAKRSAIGPDGTDNNVDGPTPSLFGYEVTFRNVRFGAEIKNAIGRLYPGESENERRTRRRFSIYFGTGPPHGEADIRATPNVHSPTEGKFDVRRNIRLPYIID